MLSCGLSCNEFVDVVRRVYVRVATEDYGIRGRPTNISRVSALTGLSRKIVRKIRDQHDQPAWTPDEAGNPLNTIIHYWRFDPLYFRTLGSPRQLDVGGEKGFEGLARKYVSGIPAATLRKEMLRLGIASTTPSGRLVLEKYYAYPSELDSDFLRNWAFSLGSLGGTLAHNARLVGRARVTEDVHIREGRFEQIAWSRRLPDENVRGLQEWTRIEGHNFVHKVDEWIAKHESGDVADDHADQTPSVGVGVYYFLNNQ